MAKTYIHLCTIMIKIIIMFKTIPIKVKFYTAKEFLANPQWRVLCLVVHSFGYKHFDIVLFIFNSLQFGAQSIYDDAFFSWSVFNSF